MRTTRLIFGLALLAFASSRVEAESAVERRPCHSHSENVAGTQRGLFAVQMKCDRLLFEIQPSMLGRVMLLNTEFAQLGSAETEAVAPGLSADTRVMQWVKRGDQVHLEVVQFEMRADAQSGLQRAVQQGSLGQLVRSFDVIGEGAAGAPIIDVTSLFVSDVPQSFAQEFRRKFRMGHVDSKRSYIDHVKAFPENIEIGFFQTWSPDPRDLSAEARGAEPPPGGIGFVFHTSMLLLPEQPMQGRYADDRIGYFAESFTDYGTRAPGAVRRGYIQRYRLEKKEPLAEVSEPVKPIVFYLAREVPDRWRPYIKQGIEDWQPVFEKAGFRHAIIARDAPSESEDPAWDAEDSRYSVIRWAPGARPNAMGPGLADPRSGEVISAHAIFWHNVLKLLENWYFAQVGALDSRARQLPLPDDVLGPLLRYVVTHEVGHALGLRHNFKAHSAYSVAQLRSREWTSRWGTSASIMSYARFNYVAQPGDDAQLVPKFGPYDYYAVEWGYKPLPGLTADEEWPVLDRMAARQIEEPMLRFGGEDEVADMDPEVMTVVLGADALEATELGLRNIDRGARLLIDASSQLGRDYTRLTELYQALVAQRDKELFAVAKLVGGVVETRSQARRGSAPPFEPVLPQRQRAAVKFLIDRGFATPTAMLDPQILRRMGPSSTTDALQDSNARILARLLDPAVLQRMAEASDSLTKGERYTGADLIVDLNGGLFSELDGNTASIALYRRDLQRAYVKLLVNAATGAERAVSRASNALRTEDSRDEEVASTRAHARKHAEQAWRSAELGAQQLRESPGPSEFSAAMRFGVQHLAKRLEATARRVKDFQTQVHLRDLVLELEKAP